MEGDQSDPIGVGTILKNRVHPPHLPQAEPILAHLEGHERLAGGWVIEHRSELSREELEALEESSKYRDWGEELEEFIGELSAFANGIEQSTAFSHAVSELELRLEKFRLKSKNLYHEDTASVYVPIGLDYNKNFWEYVRAIKPIREFIKEKYTGWLSLLDRAEKNRLLDEFTSENPGAPISEYVEILFPEPKVDQQVEVNSEKAKNLANAPTPWANREPDDNPVSFVKRHYGVWRDGAWNPNGLTMTDLRHDMQLYNALTVWERRHPKDRLNLPKQGKGLGTWVDRVGTGPGDDPEAKASVTRARELEREARALRRGLNKERS